MHLTYFTIPSLLAQLDRPVLTRFLEERQQHLPPAAAALLADKPNPDFEQFCAAWAAQFGALEAFGAPLREALAQIGK